MVIQANRIAGDEASTHNASPWDWKLERETQFDEYADVRKGKINRSSARVEKMEDGSF
jgi:hypothetical protein